MSFSMFAAPSNQTQAKLLGLTETQNPATNLNSKRKKAHQWFLPQMGSVL